MSSFTKHKYWIWGAIAALFLSNCAECKNQEAELDEQISQISHLQNSVEVLEKRIKILEQDQERKVYVEP